MSNGIARVVVDIALDREFDYLIPQSLSTLVRIGSRVMVPFGRSDRSGYVVGLSSVSGRVDLKAIASVIGKSPLLSEGILDLARWISDYYCSPVEHAVRAVLPGAVRRKGAGFKECRSVALSGGGGGTAMQLACAKLTERQKLVLQMLRDANGSVLLADLLRKSGVSAPTVKSLEKKGFVKVSMVEVGRNPLLNKTVLPTKALRLTPEQDSALEMAKKAIDHAAPPVILLHGVTGSGKTEVYLQAIEYAMAAGGGAVVLVPEISLTPQTVERFRGRFGDNVAVLHSHLSEGERHDEWHRIREGKARIAIGARSAVFAPVINLRLIVVDEEHDTSYKQDESPRYNARDVAVMRGRMERCAVILGSATPSMESYDNVQTKKYSIAVLSKRIDHRKMPVVQVVDMRGETGQEGRVNVFSRELVDAVRLRLDRAEQTILFLNRRGYATSLLCPKCGFVEKCGLCSIPFTYHQYSEELMCHVCGSVRRVPDRCGQCGDPAFRFAGIGTQRVEKIVSKLFPKAKVARMDSDTTRRKDSHEEILGEFKTGKIDILVGTQMIAKGLDFPNVTLIGVINADLSLHVPDFRAGERTFQLLTQVSGRAGRGDIAGEVIIQTFSPGDASIQAAVRMDYVQFYEHESGFRRELGYPPFAHVVCITARGIVEDQVVVGAESFAKNLRLKLPQTVVLNGPVPAPLARAKGYYRYQLVMRARSVKAMVYPTKELLKTFKWPAKVTCSVDVDAISFG